MSISESYQNKIFVVNDEDARIRRDDDLMAFVPGAAGHFQTIPNGTTVMIVEIKIAEGGSHTVIVFGRATSVDGSRVFGWTSTRNLAGKFMNETLGLLQPRLGAGRYGPNAAWANGEYLGQIELVAIVDSKLEIEYLAANSVEAYLALVAAAARDDIQLTLNSGFRSYPEQKYLHDGFRRGSPGFNTAAKPGFSKHQKGIAFDLSVSGGDGNPTYEWLKLHATAFGFVRTVDKEPWHWEFDEPKAQGALAANTFKTATVTV